MSVVKLLSFKTTFFLSFFFGSLQLVGHCFSGGVLGQAVSLPFRPFVGISFVLLWRLCSSSPQVLFRERLFHMQL